MQLHNASSLPFFFMFFFSPQDFFFFFLSSACMQGNYFLHSVQNTTKISQKSLSWFDRTSTRKSYYWTVEKGDLERMAITGTFAVCILSTQSGFNLTSLLIHFFSPLTHFGRLCFSFLLFHIWGQNFSQQNASTSWYYSDYFRPH